MSNQNYDPNDSKILVIASQDISYQKICKILADANYNIQGLFEENLTEETILHTIEKYPISLIFLSNKFPNFDSYELGKKIKTNQKSLGEIPLIFLGEFEYNNGKTKAFQVGGQDYICPPYYEEEILTKVSTFLKIITLQQKLQEATNQLSQINASDTLTHLANKHHFLEYLEQEWNRCARERVSLGDGDYTMLSLIFIAMDIWKNDKKNNDLQEDKLLIQVAETLKNRLKRPKDLLARYENNIFGIILPNTDSLGLARLMDVLFGQIKHFQKDNLIKFRLGGVSRIPSRALASEILIDVGLEALEKAKNNEVNPLFLDSEEIDFED